MKFQEFFNEIFFWCEEKVHTNFDFKYVNSENLLKFQEN
jgi:hypothetical protein